MSSLDILSYFFSPPRLSADSINWNTFCHRDDNDRTNILYRYNWLTYIIILLFCVVFTIPIVIVLVRREYPEMKARSPYLMVIFLVMLLFDVSLNTWIL